MSEIGQKLIDATRKVAAERPDFVYPNTGACVYVKDGAPGCIVGHAAWNVGLINADFECVPANRGGVYSLDDHLNLGLDNLEREWLGGAQEAQDNGYTWGMAIERADAGLRE